MATSSVNLNLRKNLLKKQLCFAKLTDEELGMLAELLVEKKIVAGETIVTEGERVDSVYLIVTGEADVRKMIYENSVPEYQSVATLSAAKGDAIGLNETGFYSLTGLRTATVIAKTDMVLLSLTVPLFHGFSLAYSHVNEVMRQQSAHLIFRK